ncbi:MAG: hypothetical protein ABI333_30170 [bacterium]
MIELIPLGPDARLQRLARSIAIGAVLLLSAAFMPLASFQLGAKGWVLLRDSAGAAFWPLAGTAAVGMALLLAAVAALPRRPWLAATLVLLPCGLAMVGAVNGVIEMGGVRAQSDSSKALAQLAGTLATPAWALLLSGGLAAAGAVVLGARELSRARTLSLPWLPFLAALLTITVINTWPNIAKLPPRPLTSLLVAAALLGPLLAAAAWNEDAAPEPDGIGGAGLALCVLLAGGAALAATGAEALLFRAAALFAQGPGMESHDHAMAFGGARGNTIRAISGAVVFFGAVFALVTTVWRFRERLLPDNHRGRFHLALVVTLVLITVGLGFAHRYGVGRSVQRANRAPPAATKPP